MTTDAKGPTKCNCSCRDKSAPVNPPIDLGDISLTFKIITEAKDVYAETGLTPREMMDERNRMKRTLEEIAYKDGSFCDCRNPPDMCDCAQRKAREALSPEKKEPKS